jgi:hypothetical protein
VLNQFERAHAFSIGRWLGSCANHKTVWARATVPVKAAQKKYALCGTVDYGPEPFTALNQRAKPIDSIGVCILAKPTVGNLMREGAAIAHQK